MINMKKILVVGATYIDNFGDMLFAKMIADALDEKCEFRYYLLSDFAQNFVGANRISNFDLNVADALVYMPGGFLGDRHDTSLITTWRWFRRYFPIGIKFARKKKPILFLGVGAGPCKYTIMKKIIKYVCKRSQKIIVRESDSQEFLNSIGIKSTVTSDLAQLITDYELPEMNLDFGSKKKFLIHVNQNEVILEKIIPAIRKFYEKHKEEYSLVVASDQRCPNDYKIFDKLNTIAENDVYYYKYTDPMELCKVITKCDTVLTYKLHMGIVSCAYGKSVVAIPEHYKKVERYYKQIGYSERVLPFYLAESDSIYELIEKYHDKPITIPEKVLVAARKNYDELDAFLRTL